MKVQSPPVSRFSCPQGCQRYYGPKVKSVDVARVERLQRFDIVRGLSFAPAMPLKSSIIDAYSLIEDITEREAIDQQVDPLPRVRDEGEDDDTLIEDRSNEAAHDGVNGISCYEDGSLTIYTVGNGLKVIRDVELSSRGKAWTKYPLYFSASGEEAIDSALQVFDLRRVDLMDSAKGRSLLMEAFVIPFLQTYHRQMLHGRTSMTTHFKHTKESVAVALSYSPKYYPQDAFFSFYIAPSPGGLHMSGEITLPYGSQITVAEALADESLTNNVFINGARELVRLAMTPKSTETSPAT